MWGIEQRAFLAYWDQFLEEPVLVASAPDLRVQALVDALLH